MKKPRYGKMKKAWKSKWVKALRSGKYTQTTANLMDLDDDKRSHCCLGVLYEVVTGRALTGSEGIRSFPTSKIANTAMKAGSFDYYVDDVDSHPCAFVKLASLNDGAEWSFKKIATWIEKNL